MDDHRTMITPKLPVFYFSHKMLKRSFQNFTVYILTNQMECLSIRTDGHIIYLIELDNGYGDNPILKCEQYINKEKTILTRAIG